MPNLFGALEVAAKVAAEAIERAAPNTAEDLVSLAEHGSNNLGTKLDLLASESLGEAASRNVAGKLNSSMHLIQGEQALSAELPSLIISNAATENSMTAALKSTAKGRELLPWEHPLRVPAPGYDPWLEGI
jgi:hypothetical protein